MKRIICVLISVSILLCFWGCQKKDSNIILHFYYPRQNYGYDELEGHFSQQSAQEELREDIVYRSSRQVIDAYLLGPLDPALSNPFPAGTQLVTLRVEGAVLHMTLTDQLAQLTGIPLIMACACLAKTAITLTNTAQVQIKCESAMLDGERVIVMSKDSVIFDDPIFVDENQ